MELESSALLDLLEGFETQDGAGRLQQLDLLQALIRRQELQDQELQPTLDSLCLLLKDSNHKVCHKGIQVLQALVQQYGGAVASYSSSFFLVLVERLGDAKHLVREAAAAALQTVLQTWDLAQALCKLLPIWSHRSPRVKQGTMQAVTEAVAAQPVALALPGNWDQLVLKPAAQLLDDANSGVREAATACIEELHQQLGGVVMAKLEALNAKPAQLKQLQARLGQLAVSGDTVQDFPLFQAVTGEPSGRHPGSMTSRSDSSTQSAGTESLPGATASTSPTKLAASRSQAGTPQLQRTSKTSTDAKRGLIAALPRGGARRGGFKDPGGLIAGELPDAPPIWVESERDLKHEIEKLVVALDEKQDWTKRIEALVRVEGLVRGGAAGLEGFLDMLKPLRQPLTVQVNDRRSAVSRQACRILGLLAAALGARFDMYALYFLPIIFKITVITVQVMAEAADLCAHTLVHHCRSPRLLKPIADALCTDKNAKLRHFCAKYMLQVVEDWDTDTYSKGLDLVEACIRSAAQDSSNDTRSIGRSMFAAYTHALPHKAQAFLRRMDSSLQEKLSQAVVTYVPGQYQPLSLSQLPTVSKAALPNVCSLPLPPSPTPSSRPPTGKATMQPRNAAPAEENSFSSASSHAPPHKRNSRKSVGGSALRVLSARNQETDAAPEIGEASRLSSRSTTTARRISCMAPPAPPAATRGRRPQRESPTPQGNPSDSGAKRIAVQQQAAPAFDATHLLQGGNAADSWGHDVIAAAADVCATDHSSYSESAGRAEWEAAAVAPSAGQVLALAASTGTDWKAKVEMFVSMQQLLQQLGSQSLVDSSEKLVQLVLEHIGDPHFKVAQAALEATQAWLEYHCQLMEPSLDRLLPLLALRITDPKEAIRGAAVGCLQTALALYPLEVCLPHVTRSLDAVKAAKGKTALLQVFSANCGQTVTTAAALPALRLWVGRVGGLVGDRNAEIRRAACQALHLVYTRMDGPTLLAHIANATPPEQMTLRRALSPMLPNLDAQLVPYSRSKAGQSASHPVAAATPHPTATTIHPPAPSGVHPLRSVSHTVHHKHQAERKENPPSHLPLASEFSFSSIEGHKPVVQQAREEEEQSDAAVSAQSSHQQSTAQDLLAAVGLEPSPNEVRARPLQAAPQPQGNLAAMAPQVLDQSPGEQLLALQGTSRIPSDRQLPRQHQQPADAHMGTRAVSARPNRVSVDTASTIRRTVITVAELQSTVQLEACPAQRAQRDDPVAGRLAASASASASQSLEDAAAGAQVCAAPPMHAHTSQALSVQQGMSAAGVHPEAILLQQQQHQPHVTHNQDRALQNSPALNSADHPANSPPPEGKAPAKRPAPQQTAVRRSDDADAVLHSQQAIQESVLVSAIQDVQHAQDDQAVASSVQALQLRLSHAPTAAVQACLPQVIAVLLPVLSEGIWQAQQSALLATKGIASQSGCALRPWAPALIPALLQATCHSRPEVCMAADEGLGALLPQQPPAVCLPWLKANLPGQGTVNSTACQPAPLIHASVKNIGRVVQRMSSADLLPELQTPDLLPGLFEAFDHSSADVRKAVTMCLTYMWQVMGDDLKPFLSGLRVSKIKLVTAYVEQAQSQRRHV